MEYRGKRYTVVQGLGVDSWKWQAELDEKTIKSGEAKTRAAAETSARWVIDKELAPKKVKPMPPSGDREPPGIRLALAARDPTDKPNSAE